MSRLRSLKFMCMALAATAIAAPALAGPPIHILLSDWDGFYTSWSNSYVSGPQIISLDFFNDVESNIDGSVTATHVQALSGLTWNSVSFNGTDALSKATIGGTTFFALDHSIVLGAGWNSLVLDIKGGTGSVGASISGSPVAVPEPASWALMLCGFGLAGVAMRSRRSRALNLTHA